MEISNLLPFTRVSKQFVFANCLCPLGVLILKKAKLKEKEGIHGITKDKVKLTKHGITEDRGLNGKHGITEDLQETRNNRGRIV